MDRPIVSLTTAEMTTEVQVARADRDTARSEVAALKLQVAALQQHPQPLATPAAQDVMVRLQRPQITRDLTVIKADSSTGTLIITVTD